MVPQALFIDLATSRVQMSNASTSSPTLILLQGTTAKLRVGFSQDAVPQELPDGTTGRFVAKAKNDFEGDPILFDANWSVTGDGVSARYEFELVVDSLALRQLLSGKAHLEVGAQIEWDVPAEATPRKSMPFDLVVVNSYSQEDDGIPDPAMDAAWAWLKTRLLQGTNMTLSIDDTAKTITFASTGAVAGTVSWDDVTGKPSTFAPSSHSHTTADLPLATQAQAEAGSASNVLMTPLRVAQAIAALETGGGSSVTHARRVYVDGVRGSDLTGLLGREDKPFATLNAAWTAWESHPDYPTNTVVMQVVLGPGAYSLTREAGWLAMRVTGAGVNLTTCAITQTGAAGAAGVYGDPNGVSGGDVTLILESDHSVKFTLIDQTAGNGGDAYYTGMGSIPGLGGQPTALIRDATIEVLSVKTGTRGADWGAGITEARGCYVELLRCDVLGTFTARVQTDGGQIWSVVYDWLKLRFSRLWAISLLGVVDTFTQVGSARCCDITTGAGGNLSYTGCAGPDA